MSTMSVENSGHSELDSGSKINMDIYREMDEAIKNYRPGPGEAEIFVVSELMPDPRLPAHLQDREARLIRLAAEQFGLGTLPKQPPKTSE